MGKAPHSGWVKPTPERHIKAYEMRQAGMTYKAIGKEFGITTMAVVRSVLVGERLVHKRKSHASVVAASKLPPIRISRIFID